MRRPPPLVLERVRLVRDADGARCLECDSCWTVATNSGLPWTWRQSQALHERGARHRTELFRFTSPTAAAS